MAIGNIHKRTERVVPEKCPRIDTHSHKQTNTQTDTLIAILRHLNRAWSNNVRVPHRVARTTLSIKSASRFTIDNDGDA